MFLVDERVSSIIKPRISTFFEKGKEWLEAITGGVGYDNDIMLGEEMLIVLVLLTLSERVIG